MERSQDSYGISLERIQRSLRIKENYISDHRKHIDHQVSVDASSNILINLKSELSKYLEEWELVHMRYELMVSDEELTDVCARAYSFRREVSDHLQRLTDLIEVKTNSNSCGSEFNVSSSSVGASTVTGPQLDPNRRVSEYINEIVETSYLINPLESLTNSLINNTISLSNSKNVRFAESNVNTSLGVVTPGACAPPLGLEPIRFSTPYQNTSLTHSNVTQDTTRGHVRNVIDNNIQGVVNDSNQNQNIQGVQNDFYTNQTFSGDILNDTIPDNQLNSGQNISVNNCVNESNLSVNQAYMNNSGVNEYNFPTNNSCVARNVPVGNVSSMHNMYQCHSGNIPSTHVRDVINANISHTVRNSTPMISNSLGNNVGYVQNVPNIGFNTFVQQNPPINTPIVSNTDHYQNAPFLRKLSKSLY